MARWDVFPPYRRLRELAEALQARAQALQDENAGLKDEVANLRARIVPTWAPPGHFYSPLVDPNDEAVKRRLNDVASGWLPERADLQLDLPLIRNWIDRIASHYHEAPFTDERQEGLRYFYKNAAFTYGDALALFGILLELKPRRLIEIGSGYSSCAAMDTNDRMLAGSIDMKFIEPYPETLLSLLPEGDPYRERIVVKRLQDVPTERFAELGRGDILFIDSSHVGKMGSDVNDYLFRILPSLKPGVVVHIHDIPYPFEYGPQWIVEENRSWNEAYLLRAFLQFNTAFRVFYFNHFVYRQFESVLAEKMPLCLRDCGASIWMEKLGDPPVTDPRG